MSKKSRLRNMKATEGSRAFRRIAANAHVTKNMMAGLNKFIESKAADRPTYVKLFFTMWESAVASVDSAAEEILKRPHVELTRAIWERLYEPYGTFQLIYFARLMDHLEPTEAERFNVVQAQYNDAWQKFFASTLVRHCDLCAVVDRLSESRRLAHEEVVDLFTGEALPMFTPQWAKALQTLNNGYKTFAEGLRK